MCVFFKFYQKYFKKSLSASCSVARFAQVLVERGGGGGYMNFHFKVTISKTEIWIFLVRAFAESFLVAS